MLPKTLASSMRKPSNNQSGNEESEHHNENEILNKTADREVPQHPPPKDPFPWSRRLITFSIIAGCGALGYWIITSLFATSETTIHSSDSDLKKSTWVPTSWSTLTTLLKLKEIKAMIFRKDAVFFQDNEGKCYVTGVLPGSVHWLFEQSKQIPTLLSIPFSRELALLPFQWTLTNFDGQENKALSIAELPDFNDIEAKLNVLSAKSTIRDSKSDTTDTLWSSLTLLALTSFCMSMDWPWSSSLFSKKFFTRKSPGSEKTRVSFNDVAGHRKTKDELRQIIQFLQKPQDFIKLGARMPRGILLEGKSGTGKTLLAKAVSGEAQVPFFYVPASSFVEIYVGQGASRVRQFFDQARKSAPCVVFIDEIDAMATSRSLLGSSNQEYVQTLNQLLTEMDGLERSFEDKGDLVIVIAATNRYGSLDEALTRPGRFDRVVRLNVPTLQEREEICHIHTRNKRLDFSSVNLKTVAELTDGWTGAELECLFNEAALLAARSSSPFIQSKHISQILSDLHMRRQPDNSRQMDGNYGPLPAQLESIRRVFLDPNFFSSR